MNFKPSRYNYFFTVKNKTVIFNSFSTSLAEVDNEFLNLYNDIVSGIELNDYNKSLLHDMIESSIIVKKDIDEIELVKKRYQERYDNSTSLHLIIAPTLECNFKCFYCYENAENSIISNEIQKAIIEIVETNAASGKNINVVWYGGEPLLVKDIIYKLSKSFISICECFGVEYSSEIITNGYLIERGDLDLFIKSKIRMFQITLDGTEKIHNSRRILKSNDNGNSFLRIMENLLLLHNRKFDIKLRINVDKTNYLFIEELLDFLIEYGLNDLDVSLGLLRNLQQEESTLDNIFFSIQEFSELFLQFQTMLYKKGFFISAQSIYPMPKSNSCTVDAPNSFVICPKGNIYKCIAEIGQVEKSIGNITSQIRYSYSFNSPFDNCCKECFSLPICMGGCLKAQRENHKAKCEIWKFKVKDIIKNFYIQQNVTK